MDTIPNIHKKTHGGVRYGKSIRPEEIRKFILGELIVTSVIPAKKHEGRQMLACNVRNVWKTTTRPHKLGRTSPIFCTEEIIQ